MSKGKDAEAAKGVLDYLNRQNRPFSVVDIFNNLHKEFGKTAITKACESLAEGGKIKEKINGKQKAYVADQSQFPDVDEGEIKQMDLQIVNLTEQVKTRQEEVRKFELELKGLNSSISTEDAEKQLQEITLQCEQCEKKLEKLKAGTNRVSPEEKDKIYKLRVGYVKEWKKRKRMANDILGEILEGYPKTKKHLYEEIGIETDEDCKVSIPNV